MSQRDTKPSKAIIPESPPAQAHIEALAREFVKILKTSISQDDFQEVLERNATYPTGVCASHDFTDANMDMFDAFKAIFDREPVISDVNPQYTIDTAMWNAAWDFAKTNLLTESPRIKGMLKP